jgi:hypothetical protein
MTAENAESPDLEADLAGDQDFLAALRVDRFALAVNHVFANRYFLKGGDERSWMCGERQAAALVARLRGLDEGYSDYYLREDFSGTWPDDRVEQETLLRQQIARRSKPVECDFNIKVPSYFAGADGIEEIQNAAQAAALESRLQCEFEQSRPKLEAERLKLLESSERKLAELIEMRNADVLEALHAHLTRLGWRTQNALDRAKLARRRLDRQVEVLREVKAFETRAEAPPQAWAASLEHRMGFGSGWTIGVLRDPALTEEEREARQAAHRLAKLALSGRISQHDYGRLRSTLALARSP